MGALRSALFPFKNNIMAVKEALGAIGGLLGSAVTSVANRQQQKRQHDYNRDDWHLQNAYNHPTAQMTRLEEAGLNPNLIYGDSISGATGHAGSVAPTTPIKHNYENPLKDIDTFAKLDNIKSSNDQNEANTNRLNIQAIQDASKTQGYNLDNKLKADTLKFATQNIKDQALEQYNRTTISLIDAQVANQGKKDVLKKLAGDATASASNGSIQQQRLEQEKIKTQMLQLGVTPNDPIFFRIMSQTFGQTIESMQKEVGKVWGNLKSYYGDNDGTPPMNIKQ